MKARVTAAVRRCAPQVGLLLLLAGCRDGGTEPPAVVPPPVQPDVGVRPTGMAIMPRLARGVNFGNILEASPREGSWGLTLKPEFFQLARAAGFLTVRLPVRFSNYAATTPPYTISDSLLNRVQFAIDQARANDLNIVIDMHHYRQLSGNELDPGEPAVDASLVEDRFVAMWRQIAQRFQSAPNNSVLFELLNEPYGDMTAVRWNPLLRRALAAVRESNPDRVVVVGPTSWNSADALSALSLPDDDRLVVTIHSYNPFSFTHQGAEWVGPESLAWLGTGCCNTQQLAEIAAPLDRARQWAGSRWPIWVGEWGSYGAAPMAARAQYTRIMRDAIEARGFGWSYWEFAAGFGVWDPAASAWRPAIREALVGP